MLFIINDLEVKFKLSTRKNLKLFQMTDPKRATPPVNRAVATPWWSQPDGPNTIEK